MMGLRKGWVSIVQTLRTILLCAFALHISVGTLAHASDVIVVNGDHIASAKYQAEPALRMTPDKSQLITLKREATSVMVGNPNHIEIVAESSNTLVIIPKEPGASHFTVLDQNGDVIMQRHVIVAAPQKSYLRIRRTCARGDEGCQTTSMYYCPGMCHEIAMTTQGQTATDGANNSPQPSSNAGYALTPPAADNE